MKKTYIIILVISLLLTSVIPFSTALAADPSTRSEFEVWASANGLVNEQKYGSNNLGAAAHGAALTLGDYDYQLSAIGFVVDSEDVTAQADTDTVTLTFTGSKKPTAICLGIIAVDIFGTYLPSTNVTVSVNGGASVTYTTAANFSDNAFVIIEESGINSVVLGPDSSCWQGLSYMLTANRNTQPAPSAPTVQSTTSTIVTLDTILGAEYSLDASTWQDSTTFSGLTPNTAYTFYARMKGTLLYYASPASTGTAAITPKADQSAPSAPTVQEKTPSSVTLDTIAGAEYSLDGTNWQDSTTFTSLTPNTSYTFYARLKGYDLVPPSDSSSGTSATTLRSAPSAPVVDQATSTTITLQAITDAEYSLDSSTWQDGTLFEGLTPNMDYTFYARLKGELALYPSEPSNGTVSTTLREAPSAPAAEATTSTSITMEALADAEYSLNGTDWQDSPIFENLLPGTQYTIQTRKKGDVDTEPSEIVTVDVSTQGVENPKTGDKDGGFVPMLLSTMAFIILFAAVGKISLKNNKLWI